MGAVRRLLKEKCGQGLNEIALMIPVLMLLLAYAADYGYFFLAAANITSSARTAAQYSILGYEGPAQTNVPSAGPSSTTDSVTALAMAELTTLVNASTTATIEVCSKSIGMTGNVAKCSSYTGTSALPGTNTYSPGTDPEAPRFVMHRVDVTYTVQPPVPLAIFGTSLLPSMQFHRQVSMRAMD